MARLSSHHANRLSLSRGTPVAALDIGSSKVACFIGRLASDEQNGSTPSIRVDGIGLQMCQGLRSGTVVDVPAAAAAIRAAEEAAERMAETTIDDAFVNVSCGGMRSHSVSVEVSVAGHDITDYDLARVLRAAQDAAEPDEREIIHSIPTGYSIDGQAGVRDPRGMFGDRLGVSLHIVSSQPGPLRNLISAVHQARLGVSGLVASAYASGLGVLSEDEMDLGATLIDLGAGTTSIAVFYEGSLLFTDMVPLGGGHVTSDLAYGLQTSLATAEKIKARYASAVPGVDDFRRVIDYPAIGEDQDGATNQVAASMLPGFVGPRVEEIFELVQKRLKAAGLNRLAGRTLVLTGGASQLQGISQMAERILDKKVRLAQGPTRFVGLADVTNGPAYATTAGLLAYALRGPLEAVEREMVAEAAPSASAMGRLGRWLRQAF